MEPLELDIDKMQSSIVEPGVLFNCGKSILLAVVRENVRGPPASGFFRTYVPTAIDRPQTTAEGRSTLHDCSSRKDVVGNYVLRCYRSAPDPIDLSISYSSIAHVGLITLRGRRTYAGGHGFQRPPSEKTQSMTRSV